MKTLSLRFISAFFAVVLLFFIHFFFSIQGLVVFGGLICGVGAFEFQRLTFANFFGAHPVTPDTSVTTSNVPSAATWLALRFLFVVFSMLLLLVALFGAGKSLPLWVTTVTLYFSLALWLLRGKAENPLLLRFFSASALGFVYCTLFPVFALKLLLLQDGHLWFFFLLAIVFLGDTFAYFGGSLWGEKKIMPQVSPNKTVVGAVFSLVGSVITALVFHHFWLSEPPLYGIVIAAISGSLLAQSGDFFESLIKRVAGAKDSGSIMPGHGGALDRLDGIYFSSPLIYTVAILLGV